MQAANSSWGPLLCPPLRAAWAWHCPGEPAGVHPAPDPSSLPPEAAASRLILWLSTDLGGKGRQTASGRGGVAACKAVRSFRALLLLAKSHGQGLYAGNTGWRRRHHI